METVGSERIRRGDPEAVCVYTVCAYASYARQH